MSESASVETEIFQVEAAIAAPAEKIWAIISNFGGLAAWSQDIASCEVTGAGVGAVRKVVLKSGHAVSEKLVAVDASNRSISYGLTEGVNWPLEKIVFKIQIDGTSPAIVRWSMTARPTGLLGDGLIKFFPKRYRFRLSELEQAVLRQ